MIRPNIKYNEIIAVFNAKREETCNQYLDTYIKTRKRSDNFNTVAFCAGILLSLSLLLIGFIALDNINESSVLQASWFTTNYSTIKCILWVVSIISLVALVIFLILSKIESNKVFNIECNIKTDWNKYFKFHFWDVDYVLDKNANISRALPAWVSDVKTLEGLPDNDTRYTYSYEGYNSFGAAIAIKINGYTYKTIRISFDGTEEFAKATALDFSYLDDKWNILKAKL